jgi:MIR domain
MFLLYHLANASAVVETPTYIKPGSVIRLRHTRTGKHLHLHDFRPPVSDVDFQNEVSGYGFEGIDGDASDNWVLELDESGKLLPSYSRPFLRFLSYFWTGFNERALIIYVGGSGHHSRDAMDLDRTANMSRGNG